MTITKKLYLDEPLAASGMIEVYHPKVTNERIEKGRRRTLALFSRYGGLFHLLTVRGFVIEGRLGRVQVLSKCEGACGGNQVLCERHNLIKGTVVCCEACLDTPEGKFAVATVNDPELSREYALLMASNKAYMSRYAVNGKEMDARRVGLVAEHKAKHFDAYYKRSLGKKIMESGSDAR